MVVDERNPAGDSNWTQLTDKVSAGKISLPFYVTASYNLDTLKQKTKVSGPGQEGAKDFLISLRRKSGLSESKQPGQTDEKRVKCSAENRKRRGYRRIPELPPGPEQSLQLRDLHAVERERRPRDWPLQR